MWEFPAKRRNESWVDKALSKPILYVTGFDRQIQKELIWLEITESDLKDIQAEYFECEKRFVDLQVFRDGQYKTFSEEF